MKHKIKVEILGESGKGKSRYRLKVSVNDIGLHVMGMLIQPSIIEGEKWYVTPPAHRVGNKYYKDVTFDTSQTLWEEIEIRCIQQLEAYLELDPIKRV